MEKSWVEMKSLSTGQFHFRDKICALFIIAFTFILRVSKENDSFKYLRYLQIAQVSWLNRMYLTYNFCHKFFLVAITTKTYQAVVSGTNIPVHDTFFISSNAIWISFDVIFMAWNGKLFVSYMKSAMNLFYCFYYGLTIKYMPGCIGELVLNSSLALSFDRFYNFV